MERAALAASHDYYIMLPSTILEQSRIRLNGNALAIDGRAGNALAVDRAVFAPILRAPRCDGKGDIDVRRANKWCEAVRKMCRKQCFAAWKQLVSAEHCGAQSVGEATKCNSASFSNVYFHWNSRASSPAKIWITIVNNSPSASQKLWMQSPADWEYRLCA